jgi:NAD-dependent dihydropyrimidine dehydrogenase PreA subunit
MKTIRNIVTIDESKCNGCGLCVPKCAEGAIRIVDGKAKLMGENLCDGLGACLGHCPMDAITVEQRSADAFDERAVHEHLAAERDAKAMLQQVKQTAGGGCPGGGCPGAAARELKSPPASPACGCDVGCDGGADSPAGCECGEAPAATVSELRHWPVQLGLVPARGSMWRDADVLIATDCVSVACPDFHRRLLAGRTLAITCPKLDDVEPYADKLATIFADNPVRSVTVAHMEVPCCSSIVRLVEQALTRAGRTDIRLRDVTVGIDGSVR